MTLNRGERTVVVKGLSEKEVPANIVIWPIAFTEASNDLTELYEQIKEDKASNAKHQKTQEGKNRKGKGRGKGAGKFQSQPRNVQKHILRR